MKILTCNTGYLLGYQTILGGYVPSPIGALVGDGDVERRKLDQLVSIIDNERPDVISLLEVDRGSHRTVTDGQFRALTDALRQQGLSYGGEIVNKYGERGLKASLPFFNHLGNAVLSRGDRPIMSHYLSAGRKRLVIEVELPDDRVLFLVHLSLRARSRRHQLDELAELITERANGREVIITGDFNSFRKTSDLRAFADRIGLSRRVPGETVPARPLDDVFVSSRCLDLFICSPDIAVDRCDVLDVQLSDHRPIVLETTA